MCCVKYGVTSDHVLGLEVVLAGGEVLHCGRRTAKGVAGYDLTSLFVGSEGTLGVITEITVGCAPPPAAVAHPGRRLRHARRRRRRGRRRSSAGGLTAEHARSHRPGHLSAIEAFRPMGLPDRAPRPCSSPPSTPARRAPDDLAAIAALCREAQAADVHVATDAAEADALLAARRLAHPAMEQFAAHSSRAAAGSWSTTSRVPRTRLVELIEASSHRRRPRRGRRTVGHAGDGNLHPIIVIDRSDPASLARARRSSTPSCRSACPSAAPSTGEHGVGLLKRDWLAREIGPTGLKAHRSIKAALDPDNILNPGKIF